MQLSTTAKIALGGIGLGATAATAIGNKFAGGSSFYRRTMASMFPENYTPGNPMGADTGSAQSAQPSSIAGMKFSFRRR